MAGNNMNLASILSETGTNTAKLESCSPHLNSTKLTFIDLIQKFTLQYSKINLVDDNNVTQFHYLFNY